MGETHTMVKTSDGGIIDEYFNRFIDETTDPRAFIQLSKKQYIAIGKLKKPTTF